MDAEKERRISTPPEADTVPGTPARPRLEDDDRFRALAHASAQSRAYLADRAWDNLAHIEHFARACDLARALHDVAVTAAERRAVAHLLYPLLPVGARAHAFLPLADDVAARAPDFRIFPGDVPHIAPVYSAFLARPDLIELLLAPGALVLAPKSVCPGGARGNATAIIVESVRAPTLPPSTSAPPAVPFVKGRVPTQVSGTAEALTVRTGPDGKALLTVDGKTEPVGASLDVVTAWLFSAGPDARGLDLRNEDDRALLLSFVYALRKVLVRGRSAYAWLEDNGAPIDVRRDVVTACIGVAVDVVARHTIDPVACRISLRADAGDGSWQRSAATMLDALALFHDVHARVVDENARSRDAARAKNDALPASSPAPGATGSVDSGPPASFAARDIVWADAFLPPGFAAGRASAVGAGRAFARLATSLLAPLGVLPLSGLKDGSGDVVLQRIVPGDTSASTADGAHLDAPQLVSFAGTRGAPRALLDAWQSGDGTALPDPKGAPRHDVSAMPAWLAFFLEGLSS